ncbi:metal-dependent hydrolase [Fundidesulfovibrio soli]|uniref:metal-dependent hydrolase n=1 Tax=Fundidesulfovibrio soli TaxID=2922716 RepID=UPI001FAF316C
MPTILTHPAVPLAVTFALGPGAISRPLLLAGIAASILPDLDVIAFRIGVPYASELGHRGFSHSLLFAVGVALAGACFCKLMRTTFRRAFLFLLVCAVSHGLLDAFTNGGLGVAFFWPWSGQRYFFPTTMIEAAPLSLARFVSPRGAVVLWSEFLWVWAPLFVAAALTAALRPWRRQSRA